MPLIRLRLAQLAAHLVVALIALVVIGGATRVMEAGLACPDWPLCFGSFLPGRQMNIQVFLEWFHRLDAFVVGIALLFQLFAAFIWRSKLPVWLPWVYLFLVGLIGLQGGLGALTVLNLLPAEVVTAHLLVALVLVAVMSGLSQVLLASSSSPPPSWWPFLSGSALISVISQCLLGGKMATTWAAHRCITNGESCGLVDLHRTSSIVVVFFVLAFSLTAIGSRGWPRRQWPFLVTLLLLLVTQVTLGMLSLHLDLSQPIITVSHQLIASLLIALLASLAMKRPDHSPDQSSEIFEEQLLETCHG